MGMKLRFLFRSLYVSKENESFDKFTTLPDASDLYLSAFVIVRRSLNMFAFHYILYYIILYYIILYHIIYIYHIIYLYISYYIYIIYYILGIWDQKSKNIDVSLEWSILDKVKPYSPGSRNCMLCLTKYHILFSGLSLLNKRTELESKCRHENKYYLLNYKSVPP